MMIESGSDSVPSANSERPCTVEPGSAGPGASENREATLLAQAQVALLRKLAALVIDAVRATRTPP